MQLGKACQKPKRHRIACRDIVVEKVEKDNSGSAEKKGTWQCLRVKTLHVTHFPVKGGMKCTRIVPRPPKGS